MASTILSSKGQVVIPRAVRERWGLEAGATLDIEEIADGLFLRVRKPAARQRAVRDWRAWRGKMKGTKMTTELLAERRREAKR
jgi:AbrB family looped-hinge helix DNA binding protein